MNTAIIVAAGSGTRFGAEKPKQFLEILGKPLIVHTLECFESCPTVDEIVVVLPAAEIGTFRQTVDKYNLKKLVKTVAGGTSRAESVFNGLKLINSKRTQIVAVHDGARPLVSTEEITRTIEKARETGAACLVADVTDTIKEIRDGKIVGTIDRRGLRRALTPQAFRCEILKLAFEAADLSEATTDECFLVEKLGYQISVVEGMEQNIKITTQKDFALAEIFLNEIAIRKSKIENV